MKKTIEVQVCDNPSCKKIVSPVDGIFYGFMGTVEVAGDWGGTGCVDWFACKQGCVIRAISAEAFPGDSQ